MLNDDLPPKPRRKKPQPKKVAPIVPMPPKLPTTLDYGVQEVLSDTYKSPFRRPPNDPPNSSFLNNQPPKKETSMPESIKPLIITALVVFCLIVGYFVCTNVIESVPNGKYHVVQSAVKGDMTAYMRPGMYWQNFGTVSEWPVAETFYFTKDSEGGDGDASIEVRFNDGSICQISGTCRVDFPKTESEAINLSLQLGYRTYQQVEDKLLTPVIRRSLVMTANLMSAKESYSDRRSEFFQRAWDQIENGIYITKDEVVVEIDPITSTQINKTRKVIVLDEHGQPQREKTNPLHDTGIRLSNFEIKNFVYEDKVQKQIGSQQEAMMAVQTARANAQRAQQDALTVEAQGKADVMKARYLEEQEKVKAEVVAQKNQSVAVIDAQKLVDVATKEKEQAIVAATRNKEVALIELEAAKLEKQRQIELGMGESERKKLIMQADGALEKKLDAWVKSQEYWAAAFKERKVPSTVMGGGNGGDSDVSNFMQIMTAKALNDISLDMSVKGGQINRVDADPATPTKK